MRLLMLLIGWCLPISNAFTHPAANGIGTTYQARINYDRSTLIHSTTSDPQLLTDDTEFIQKNIEFAATSASFADTDNGKAIASTTAVHNRFDRVVGPKHVLIYDTTLRGMFLYFLLRIIILLQLTLYIYKCSQTFICLLLL